MTTMRTIFFALLFLICFSNQISGQVMTDTKNQTPQELYDFHMSKHKTNKLAAWITLGGGLSMVVAGFGINTSGGIVDGDSTNNKKGLWLSYLGGATTLTSIPLFIASGKYKKKARIQLQNGAIGLNNTNYTGISVAFTF